MDFTKYQEMIDVTIDMSKVEKHEYLINPDFDDTLKGIL